MEKDRGARVISLVALLIAVIGLSIGFASYTRNVSISTTAKVTPVNTFNVRFSSSNQEVETDNIVPTKSVQTITATEAEIDNNDTMPTLTNLSATFTEPGQSVEYLVYVTPTDYNAYLRGITYNAAEGSEESKVCTAVDTTTTNATTVTDACKGISLKVEVVGDNNKTATATKTESNLSGYMLTKNTYGQVKVTISYEENSAKADGDFDVKFGDITLVYSTADGQ